MGIAQHTHLHTFEMAIQRHAETHGVCVRMVGQIRTRCPVKLHTSAMSLSVAARCAGCWGKCNECDDCKATHTATQPASRRPAMLMNEHEKSYHKTHLHQRLI